MIIADIPTIAKLFVVAAAGLAAATGTAWLCRRAPKWGLMDVPGARSSHLVPTPRGGGLAIAAAVLAAWAMLALTGALATSLAAALAGGGIAVAAIGWRDDLSHVPPSRRLAVHAAATTWLVVWLPPLRPLELGLGTWALNPTATVVLAALTVVWLINLTNFMDGIDGLAAVEVSTTAITGAGLLWAADATGLALAAAALGAAAAGFLPFNWPPARIFMGDVGSGFVGYSLAALMLAAYATAGIAPWPWLILLGAFIVDATVTLIRRAWRRERLSEAHRSHAYQHAAQRWGHRTVTLAVLAINTVWLLPWALWAAQHPDRGVVAMAIAYAPLLILVLRLGAGGPTPGLPSPAP